VNGGDGHAGRDLCGVLLNARASGVARDRALLGAVRELVGADGRVEITDDLALVPAAVERIAAGRPRVVAFCGGDGTLSCGLAALDRTVRARGEALPPLLLLRAGTMTTIVRGLGERRAPLAALQATLRDLREGRPPPTEPQPYVRCNDAPGFIIGAVIIARLLERYYGAGGEGPQRAWRMVPRVVGPALLGRHDAQTEALFAPEPARLVVDGMALPLAQVRMLLAGTVADVGIGMKFLYRARERAGLFHVVALDAPAAVLARRFPRAFLGQPWNVPESFDGLATSLTVEFDRPQRYIHDGELREAATLRVVHGGALDLVR
jgi:diacylglycerol kinase family enzyme